MKKLLKFSPVAIAVLMTMNASTSYAQTFAGSAAYAADTDNTGGGEYVQFTAGDRSNGALWTGITAYSPGTGTPANAEGSIFLNAPTGTQITVDANNNGNGSFSVWSGNGAGGSVSTMSSTAQASYINSWSNAATPSLLGQVAVGNGVGINASVNADTNINTGTSTGNVTIGNAANTTTIQSGTNNITGTTNNITGTTNNITGVTNINASANNATNINTGTSTAAVTVGNSANTTNFNSAINNIGVNAYATTNNMGTGSAASVNNIGNSQTASQVNAQAGNAKMTLLNNSASMTVPSGAAGVNNGFAATPTNSTMTGGNTAPTRLTMNDNAATFGRVSNGAPITVTGVADGRNDFDAVNVRQYAGAIAAVAAQANVPSLAAGQDRTIGLGLGNFMGKTGMALGMNLRDQDVVYKLSLSSSLNGGAQTVFAGGAAWSF